MTCPESLHTQAYFDGELDAPSAADVERHLDGCAACRAQLQEFANTSHQVRDAFAFKAPPQLRARIEAELDGMTPRKPIHVALVERSRVRPFWSGVFSGATAALAVAMMVAFLLLPSRNEVLLDGLLSEHVESLSTGHLIAVESSDHHTVKPWFAGRTAASPTVADFASDGFTLVGGRTDYLAHQWAAVVVYRHGRHIINVFSWRASSLSSPNDNVRDGYRLAFWEVGGLQYCAVSDASWESLRHLRELLRTQAVAELQTE